MTQYNTLNVKLPYSQLNKLKSGIKNGTEVMLKTSLNAVSDSDHENNFSHDLFLTNMQVSKLRKVFANNTSADKKLSKTLLHKIVQSGGFLGSLLGPLLKPGLPLIGNVLKPLPKRVLIPLRLIAAESAADAAIHQKMFAFGRVVKVSDRTHPSDLALRTLLMISNEEMNDVMKIIKSFEKSGLLIKGFNRTIKSEAKEKKEDFLVCY